MYHYTYLIRCNKTKMKYIGARSSICHPRDDTQYWSSSKHLPKDVKETHSKRILKIFETRKEALEHEIYLHFKHDVGKNKMFYNKAKQTTTSFDTTGLKIVRSEETRKKLSIANKGKKRSKECVEALRKRMLGHKQSKKTCEKRANTFKENGKTKGVKHHNFRPWYISSNTITYLFYNTTKSDQSIIDGHYGKYYADLMKKQNKNGTKVNTRQYGLVTIGDIPT